MQIEKSVALCVDDYHLVQSDKTTSIYNVSTRVLSKK